MSDSRIPPGYTPSAPPDRLPSDSLWPYAAVPEEPTPEELAAIHPDLRDALFGRRERPFSITLSFRPFEGDDGERALELARGAAEHVTVGSGAELRHRARFHAADAAQLHELFQLVDRRGDCEVLIDDQPVPFARELWLPLVWCVLAVSRKTSD